MTIRLFAIGANIGAANRRWAFSRPAATAPIPEDDLRHEPAQEERREAVHGLALGVGVPDL